METKNKDSGKGVAGLVLGIFSIVFSWVPFLGLATGIIGIACSCAEKPKTGMSTGGLVTSIIGTVGSAIYMLFWILIGAALSTI